MPLTAVITIDPDTKKPVLTVESDPRTLKVEVTAPSGAVATAMGVWPLLLADTSGHVWARRTDDGTTAVFDY